MDFAYGITTVPERFTTTLPRTLESLAAGGFDAPRLFVDGACAVPEALRRYEITHHAPRIRAWGNWHLALLELWIRNPHADLFAIFQDDLICVPRLREYLETNPPRKGTYGNCYTFPINAKHAPRNKRGWFESNQEGKGAVALVFPHDTAKRLLASQHFVDRPLDDRRGHKAIDGGVVTAANKAGIKEHCHMPSLVQHTGEKSVIGNRTQPQAGTFPGEDVDALSLSPGGAPFAPIAVRRSGRIGLVGDNTPTDVGKMNRQIAAHVAVDTWLIPATSWNTLTPVPEDVDVMTCQGGAKVPEFLKRVDVVIFVETPPFPNLLDQCAKHGVRTFCVPFHDQMPAACRDWAKRVDRFLCPTRHAYEQFVNNVPCVLFPWPADTSVPFQVRERCERFLYDHAWGALKDSKGASVVQALLRRQPDLPLTVFDRTATEWPGATVVRGDLDCAQGDVLLAPCAVDAVGLSCIQAAASGMPVISTDGRPWDELNPWASIRASQRRMVVRRPVDHWSAEPAHLEQLCRERLGLEIVEQSRAARAWAEARSWSLVGPALSKLLRGEIHSQAELDAAMHPQSAESVAIALAAT